MSVTVAVVGAGYMAGEHAKAFAAQPGVRIVGVVGRSRERAEALASQYDARVFEGVDDLWDALRPDVVVVAVNELSMAAVCERVFQHPWRILLEKPVGVDLADAERILAMAVTAGAMDRTWVAMNRRSYGSTRAALARLSNAGPRLVTVLDQQDMESAAASGVPDEVVRNYMFANSIHLVDYFPVFCRGELTDVQVMVPWTPRTPGPVIAALTYSSGDRGVYQAIWNGPGPWAVTVATPEARFEMRPLESLTVQARGERLAVPQDADPLDADFKPGLHVQAREMVSALQGQTSALATLEDAMASMALVARIYQKG